MNRPPSPPPAAGGHRRNALAGALGMVGALVTLMVTGRSLPFPARLDADGLVAWADEVGAVVVTFTALRAIGLVLVVWIATTAVVGVTSRRLRLHSLTRMIDRVSLPAVRRAANTVAGAALVAASITSTLPAGAQAAPPVVMRDLGPAPTTPTTSTTTSPAPTTTTAPPTPTASTTTSTTPGTAAPPTGPSTDPTPEPRPEMRRADPPRVTMRRLGPTAEESPRRPAPTTWVIRPGDTLWHVAAAAIEERSGRPAEPDETLAELRRIVEANADRLAVPGDPDLVFPGQEFVVP